MHDSHIHLVVEPLKSNLSDIMGRFISAGGKYVLTQGTDRSDYHDSINIAQQYSGTVHLALGLHPTIFEEVTIHKGESDKILSRGEKEIVFFKETLDANLKNSDLKAIGETGLDYYQLNINKDVTKKQKEQLIELQKESFKEHIRAAIENDLPMSIHARDVNGSNECIEDLLNLVAQEGRGLLKGCFHSYTGDIQFVEQILDLGFHIGFNGIITYKSGEPVRKILEKTPVERILFETDGPWLPPQSVRKDSKIKEKFAQPYDIKEIIGVAAEVKNIPAEVLERETDKNYENLFLS